MNAFNRYAAILGFALASAHAQAVVFSFTGGGGTIADPLTELTVTSSAWSDTAAGSRFEAAAQSFAADGVGVYNPTENAKSQGQGNTADALGNSKGVELILFSFSGAVSLQSLATYQVGKDSDLSVWAGIGSFSPEGMTSSAIGTAMLYENSETVAGIRIVDLRSFTGTYDWLAVAARTDHIDDFAKLKSLTVTPVAQPVPDAATWMTMLAGLGLVGFSVKRRSRT